MKGTTFFASELARGNHAQVIETSRSWQGFHNGMMLVNLETWKRYLLSNTTKHDYFNDVHMMFNHIKIACALFGFQLELSME